MRRSRLALGLVYNHKNKSIPQDLMFQGWIVGGVDFTSLLIFYSLVLSGVGSYRSFGWTFDRDFISKRDYSYVFGYPTSRNRGFLLIAYFMKWKMSSLGMLLPFWARDNNYFSAYDKLSWMARVFMSSETIVTGSMIWRLNC